MRLLSGSNLTRRAFLQTAALPLAAAACTRPPNQFAGLTPPSSSAVCLYDAPTYDANFAEIVAEGLRALGVNVAGRRVLLKPNLVEYEEGMAVNTHPAVIAGAALAIKRAGAARVVVAEGPGHRRDIEYLLTQSTLDRYLKDLNLEFVDLNHDDVVPVTLRTNFSGLGRLWLPATLMEAEIVVSMPKLKTHHWTGLTASMKNLFGVVPGAVYGWPKNLLHTHGIEHSILDLNATRPTHLTICDAVVGMEGDGPIMGHARRFGFVAMGTDAVAVDASCARVMGLEPSKVTYLEMASQFLGNAASNRIELRAEPLDRFQTRVALLEHLEHLRSLQS